MKKYLEDLVTILAIVVPVVLLFATTLLLQWDWITLLWERRILVYLLMFLEAFVGYKVFKHLSK